MANIRANAVIRRGLTTPLDDARRGRVAGAAAANGAELDDLQALLRSALRTLPHARYALYHLPAGCGRRAGSWPPWWTT